MELPPLWKPPVKRPRSVCKAGSFDFICYAEISGVSVILPITGRPPLTMEKKYNLHCSRSCSKSCLASFRLYYEIIESERKMTFDAFTGSTAHYKLKTASMAVKHHSAVPTNRKMVKTG